MESLAPIKREGYYVSYDTGESLSPKEHAIKLIKKQPFITLEPLESETTVNKERKWTGISPNT